MPGSANTGLPDDIRESVAVANVKSVAEQSSMLSNLTFANGLASNNLSQQNAVSQQQSMNQLGITVTGKTVNRISDLSPLEAKTTGKIDSGNSLAQQIASLRAARRPASPPPQSGG